MYVCYECWFLERPEEELSALELALPVLVA